MSRKLAGWVALGCIALQFGGSLLLSGIALVTWLMVMAVVDRGALKKLARPVFWTVSAVFALAAGFLLGEPDLDLWGVGMSTEGLEAGALMLVRGAFIFGLSAWASRAMCLEDLERWAATVGLRGLGRAVGVAFGLLPGLTERLEARLKPGSGRSLRLSPAELIDLAVDVVTETARTAEEIAAGRR